MKNIQAVKEAMVSEHDVDASSIGYAAVANAMPSTKEVAPFLGRTYAAGSCSQDELADKMVKAGCQMTAAEIKRVWNGTGAYLIETMPEAPRAFDIGFARLFPSIGGTFDSADGDFDKERNTLLVAATPSATIRDALAGGTPYHAAGTGLEPVVGNVTWNNMADTVKSGEPFTIIGLWLTFVAGDEYAEMSLPGDGGVVPVSVERQTSSDDGCQRLVGRLTRPVDACEGAVLTVYTHGADRTSVLRPVPSGKLTVLAGEEPPVPVNPPRITSGHSESHADDGKCYADGSGFVLEGDNLEDAIVTVAGSANGGETWSYEETVPADKVNFDADMLTIDGNWLDTWYNHLDVGELVKFTVETTQGEDSIQRTLSA